MDNTKEKTAYGGIRTVERRKHQRYTVEYISEVYQGDEFLFLTVLDISEGGAGIMLPSKFNTGNMMQLRINYRLCDHINSSFERIDISLKAEVIWVKTHGSVYRAGLKISDIEENDLTRLKNNINKLKRFSKT